MASTWQRLLSANFHRNAEAETTAAARVINDLAKACRGDEVNVDDLKKAERAIAFARECGQRGDFSRVTQSLKEATALIARIMKEVGERERQVVPQPNEGTKLGR